VAVLAVAATPALASQLDQSSTATYIGDATTLLHQVIGSEAAIRGAGRRFLAKVHATCPNALPLTRPSSTATVLAFEAGFELALTEIAPIERREVAFNTEVSRLQWNDGRIRSAVTEEAKAVNGLSSLGRLPDLCSEIKAAAAGGFAHIPSRTRRFVSRIERLSDSVHGERTDAQFLSLLKPYLTRSDAAAFGTLSRLSQTEERDLDRIEQGQAKQLNTVLGAAPYP